MGGRRAERAGALGAFRRRGARLKRWRWRDTDRRLRSPSTAPRHVLGEPSQVCYCFPDSQFHMEGGPSSPRMRNNGPRTGETNAIIIIKGRVGARAGFGGRNGFGGRGRTAGRHPGAGVGVPGRHDDSGLRTDQQGHPELRRRRGFDELRSDRQRELQHPRRRHRADDPDRRLGTVQQHRDPVRAAFVGRREPARSEFRGLRFRQRQHPEDRGGAVQRSLRALLDRPGLDGVRWRQRGGSVEHRRDRLFERR